MLPEIQQRFPQGQPTPRQDLDLYFYGFDPLVVLETETLRILSKRSFCYRHGTPQRSTGLFCNRWRRTTDAPFRSASV